MSSIDSVTNSVVEEEHYDEMLLSKQQVQAGKEIIECFIADPDGKRWVILLAQMQSGKTETYLFVCCELLRLEKVETVVIFSGNSETDLRDQLKKEVEGKGDAKFYGKYELYLEEEFGITTRARRDIMVKVKTNIIVIWGTELNKYKNTHSKTLFVWEEAHHAQTIHQCPDKFLKKIGISPNGDKKNLKKKENFVLSVSATPFSEYSDFHHFEQSKKVVYMRPGNGYNSVKHILTSGRLKPFKNVESGLKTALSTPHTSHKYAIVRISKKNEDNVLNIIRQFPSWRHVIYDSISSGDAKDIGDRTWNGMRNIPDQDTVILLRGKCRMGKNIEKQHVLFVMETAKNSNTDTVLQGLLGRVCGYSKGSNMIDVYLHDKIVRSCEIQRYINLTEGQHIIPSKACNIAKTTIYKTRHPIVPFLVQKADINGSSRKNIIDYIHQEILKPGFDFGRTEREQFYELKEKFKNKQLNVEINVHHVTTNLKQDNLERRQKWVNISKEIQYFETTGDRYPRNLWFTGITEEKKGKEEGRIINVFYYSEANEEYRIEAGSAFIYAVTETQNSHYVSKTNIPGTTGREVFAHSLEDGTEVISNGGFVIHLPSDTYRDVTLMQTYIMKFSELTLQFPESRSVTSQWDRNSKEFKGIIVKADVKQALLPGGIIYEEVKNKFGFNITLTETTGPVNKLIVKDGCSKYASICW